MFWNYWTCFYTHTQSSYSSLTYKRRVWHRNLLQSCYWQEILINHIICFVAETIHSLQRKTFLLALGKVSNEVIRQLLMIMINCFCGMAEWQKDFGLICKWEHCHRSLPLRILDTLKEGFELVQNLSSAFVEWSCAAVITTAPQFVLWGLGLLVKS